MAAGLTLRHIEVIRAVLRAGTLTGAAKQLAVSQPGLTRTLRNAETRIGLLLFERRSGRLHPTPEALALYPDIEKVYGEIEAIQRATADLRHIRGGRLVIVANPSVAATIVAKAVGALSQTNPRLRIALHTALNYEIIERVRAKSADVGLAWDVPPNPAVTVTEIVDVRLVCVLHANDPLAKRKVVTPRDLEGRPLISFTGMLPIGEALDRAFAATGISRRIDIEIGQSFIAIALVKAGAGVAVVDEMLVDTLRDGVVVKAFTPASHVRLCAVTRTERLSLVAQAFLESISKVAGEWRGSEVVGRTGRPRTKSPGS